MDLSETQFLLKHMSLEKLEYLADAINREIMHRNDLGKDITVTRQGNIIKINLSHPTKINVEDIHNMYSRFGNCNTNIIAGHGIVIDFDDHRDAEDAHNELSDQCVIQYFSR